MKKGKGNGGIEALARRYEAMANGAPAFLMGFADKMARRIVAKTKERTTEVKAVDTGNLRNNWRSANLRHEGDKILVDIINPVEYAMYVEYGRKRYPWKSKVPPNTVDWVEGRFMATWAIARVGEELPDLYAKAFKAWLKKIDKGDG